MALEIPQEIQVPERLGLIWAQAKDADGSDLGVIGKNGDMPWHVPEDLAWFRQVTGKMPVIMGRKTWESLPAQFRPLPGRQNIVISSNPYLPLAGALRADATDSAMELTDGEPAWVIGGSTIFDILIEQADTLAVTKLHTDISGADTFAPRISDDWQLVWQSDTRDSVSGISHQFEIYKRFVA